MIREQAQITQTKDTKFKHCCQLNLTNLVGWFEREVAELCIELNFRFLIPNYLYAFFRIKVNSLFDFRK